MVVVVRRRVVSVLFVLVSLVLLHAPTAQARHSVPYLALGDSVPYGWDVVTQPVTSDPSAHVGYPEVLAGRFPLAVTNAACPGETSSSFLDPLAPDNGCDDVRALAGIKADWGDGTQLDFAVDFLTTHPDTGLVTVMLGANDLFLCQDTSGGCDETEFGQVLATTGANLTATILALRGTGYSGPIVLVGYYALDYTDPVQVAISEASRDLVLRPLATAFDGVVVADGFTAFARASWRAGGEPCAAGLLLPVGGGACDVHTTPTGDRVLAQAIRAAVDLGTIVRTHAPGHLAS